jgi:ribose/xylose/arabinose/galactoside ABC-type transport system permease subunit
MLLVLVVLFVASSFVYHGFLTSDNLRNILSQNAPEGIVAVAMTFVIIAGGFDLSVGSIFALGATVFAGIALDHSILLAAVLALGLGLAAGLGNGVVITTFRVNPFVATLGSASVISGLVLAFSHTNPFVVAKPSFQTLGAGSWGAVPISIVVLVIVFVAAAFVLHRTTYGRSIFAVGGNIEASRLAGLRINLLRASTYALTGILSAFAGMMLASRLQVGQGNMGASVALDTIAMVVIGGTSLFGGEGAMWRTGVGLLILSILTNVFYSLSVDPNYQLVAKGAIVIGAVALDAFARKVSV